jgi:hypothetical protein
MPASIARVLDPVQAECPKISIYPYYDSIRPRQPVIVGAARLK